VILFRSRIFRRKQKPEEQPETETKEV